MELFGVPVDDEFLPDIQVLVMITTWIQMQQMAWVDNAENVAFWIL